MRHSIVAAVFAVGFISGAVAFSQKQERLPLPAERVTGIGGVFCHMSLDRTPRGALDAR